ncbi:MAG: helix-turn-helix transcriptional regulator [Clostridia bacterium]|nr:helix-turn-helix transcriptional regulator [Clostridia bacterium]
MNSNKLLGAMAEKGITQKELAKKLGISKNTVNSKINGKGHFDTEQAIKICEILGVDEPERKVEIFLPKSS